MTHPDPQETWTDSDANWKRAVHPAGKYFRTDASGAPHAPRERTCPQCGQAVLASINDALPCSGCLAATPQPAPQPGQAAVLPLVIADLEARATMGERKYGTRLMVENGRDHLVDAYQEALDLAMYLRAEIAKRQGGAA